MSALVCQTCGGHHATPACPRSPAIEDPKPMPPPERKIDFTGRQLGPWRLLQQVGAGAFSHVYRAEHEMIGKIAAVKVLRPEAALDEDAHARFVGEARATAMVHHPNVVQVFDLAVAASGSDGALGGG